MPQFITTSSATTGTNITATENDYIFVAEGVVRSSETGLALGVTTTSTGVTATNAGALVSAGGAVVSLGVTTQTTGSHFTNTSTGLIAGENKGFVFNGIDNSLTNHGEISVNGTAIQLNTTGDGFDFLNTGTITATRNVPGLIDADRVLSLGADAKITNYGTMTALQGTAIAVFSGDSFSLSNYGNINGQINVSDTSNSVKFFNSGIIEVETGTAALLRITEEFENTGTILGGVVANFTSVGYNSGLISSADTVFRIGVNDTLVNSGELTSLSAGGTAVLGATGDEEIENFGTITGDVIMAGGDDTFNNTGTMTGVVDMGSGLNNITNDGQIQSDVNMGIDADVLGNLGEIFGDISMLDGDDTVLNLGALYGDVNLGEGNDIYDASGGEGILFAQVNAGGGNDSLFGSSADEDLRGDNQSDLIEGNGGDDDLLGGQGQDVLRGGEGNDRLFGQSNGDTLDGGEGLDRLVGGLANDTFIFKQGNDVDIIDDFANNGIEKIDLTDWAAVDAQAAIDAAYQVGGQVRINFGDGDMLALNGLVVADLDASDFIFA